MAGTVGEIFIQLGVEGDARKIEEFAKKTKDLSKQIGVTLKQQTKANDNFSKMIRNLRRVAVATSVAILAIEKLTQNLIKDNQAWLNFQNQTDLTISKLQGYAGVASLFDKTLGIHGAAGSIQQLNDKLFELQLTGEGARGFQIAGINPVGQDAFQVIEQVRERIKGLNNTQASYLLKQIGLDPKLLPMLRLERSEFEKLRETEQRLILSDDERAEILKYQIQLGIAHQQMQLGMQRLALALMPLWTKLTQIVGDFAEGLASIIRWFRELKPLTQGLITIFGVFGTILSNKVLLRFAKLNSISKLFGASVSLMIRKIPILGTAFKGLAATVMRAFLPLYSVYLLLEDFAVYQAGGLSVIGDYLNWKKDLDEAKKQYETPNIQVGDYTIKNPNNPRAIQAAIQLEALKKLEQSNNTAGDIERVKANMLTSPKYYEQFGHTYNNTTNNSPTVNQTNIINTSESSAEARNGLRFAIGATPIIK